jgi:beta-glucanase (GH16 family)
MTRARLAALALALGCGLMPPEDDSQAAPAPERDTLPPPGYVAVWADEFDGSALDPRAWTALAEPRRDAISTPQAVAVRGGYLTITTFTGTDGVHRTGFVTTAGKFEARYGYCEARIRFNDAPGGWCSFWLLSPTIGEPLGDPGRAASRSTWWSTARRTRAAGTRCGSWSP